MKKLLTTLAILLLLTTPAVAGFKEGKEAYYKGDFVTALKELRPIAEQGDASAQYYLGFMYDVGKGVPKDYAEAVKWYRKAADQGHGWAQNNLGSIYDRGEGVPTDYAEAVKWYKKAAAQELAAAQANLGLSYAKGEGVPKDYVLAYMWCNLALAQGNEGAKDTINILEKEMTPAQIAEAQKLSRDFRSK